MEKITTCIIVDDNVIDLLIHKKILRAEFNNLSISDFICANSALNFIGGNYSEKSNKPTILLLDLNMPGMTGWEFLVQFNKMDKKIKNQIRIFVVSFSSDPDTMMLAQQNPNVELFIAKPLNRKKISDIPGLQRAVK